MYVCIVTLNVNLSAYPAVMQARQFSYHFCQYCPATTCMFCYIRWWPLRPIVFKPVLHPKLPIYVWPLALQWQNIK